MATADSTASIPETSLLKDKFNETNWAICQASLIARFLASTVSKHVEGSDSLSLDNCAAEGLLIVLNNLVERIEGTLSLLDECESAVTATAE